MSADGRPFNVETLGRQSGEPSPLETRYNRRLREAHFRPRIAGGEPVATDNVKFTHYFRYYVATTTTRTRNEAGAGFGPSG